MISVPVIDAGAARAAAAGADGTGTAAPLSIDVLAMNPSCSVLRQNVSASLYVPPSLSRIVQTGFVCPAKALVQYALTSCIAVCPPDPLSTATSSMSEWASNIGAMSG